VATHPSQSGLDRWLGWRIGPRRLLNSEPAHRLARFARVEPVDRKVFPAIQGGCEFTIMASKAEQQHNPQEAQRRLLTIMRGAFAGPPTQLKDIPKRTGESRKAKRPTKRQGYQRVSGKAGGHRP
jgi:hypothetical protein